MANKVINWFLGKAQSTSKNETGQVHAAAAVAVPQLQAVGTSGTVVSLASHGNYPLHDGIARVAAGRILPTGPSATYASMPGGWASLSNSSGAPSVAPSAAPAPMAAAAASAASAPAPSRAAVASLAPANNENTSGTASWASIPGGWATLAAAGSAAIAAHGNYPMHDGVARVAAGKIITHGPSASYAAMPGGWAALGNTQPTAAPAASTTVAAASAATTIAAAPVAVAPTAASAPAAAMAPAHNENSSGDLAWATMVAAGGAAAIAAHGNYSLHDGIARVPAGKIIPSTSDMSWAAMPGGWASLHRFA